MEKILALLLTFAMAVGLSACERAGVSEETSAALEKLAANIETTAEFVSEKENSETENKNSETELTAVMEDNATTRAIIEQMPMTLPMMDLYGREMCYRYGAYALPTDNLRSDGYEVGDIAYWAPGGSLVILYKQNGEQFERQHLGHIDSGIEVFENTEDAGVRFEVVDE
ncbi:MAG: cyclophilin-like fold protein [Ruminococcus sp.]|nr:cyclophilin-like fold protein [Ruminococcus sp.]MCM1479242.1 cyclophilin-like fold protein [Muribaculaceae bacterium]